MRTEDVVVGGWLPGQGRLTSLPGALLTGQPDPDGQLRYVGTGWRDTERNELAALLQAAATDTCPFTERPAVTGARWVVPDLVGEVRCVTRTRSGRLRQPSWHGLRPDLTPDDLRPS